MARMHVLAQVLSPSAVSLLSFLDVLSLLHGFFSLSMQQVEKLVHNTMKLLQLCILTWKCNVTSGTNDNDWEGE